MHLWFPGFAEVELVHLTATQFKYSNDFFFKGKFRAVNPSPGSLVFELLNFFLSLCKQLLSGAVTNLPRVYLYAFSG